jgi:hypothetical protein
MILDINVFFKRVRYYINEEYDKKYFKSLGEAFHLIKSYYWGGNNVPDTARAVVEYLRKHENSL